MPDRPARRRPSAPSKSTGQRGEKSQLRKSSTPDVVVISVVLYVRGKHSQCGTPPGKSVGSVQIELMFVGWWQRYGWRLFVYLPFFVSRHG